MTRTYKFILSSVFIVCAFILLLMLFNHSKESDDNKDKDYLMFFNHSKESDNSEDEDDVDYESSVVLNFASEQRCSKSKAVKLPLKALNVPVNKRKSVKLSPKALNVPVKKKKSWRSGRGKKAVAGEMAATAEATTTPKMGTARKARAMVATVEATTTLKPHMTRRVVSQPSVSGDQTVGGFCSPVIG